MTKYDIIEQLANTHQVERIVTKMLKDSKNPFDCPDDLIQDIYLILLEKPDDFIEGLYERKELGYWLLRVVRNQLLSENSPYHYTYIKERANSEDISAETYEDIPTDFGGGVYRGHISGHRREL